MTLEKTTGAENVVWDLSIFYTGPDDPALDADMGALSARFDALAAQYKGRVAQLSAIEMAAALREIETVSDQAGRIASFASLLYSTDTTNPQYGALLQKMIEWDAREEQKLVFFDLEWNNAADAHVQQMLGDPALAHYRHYLEAKRRFKPYQLSEEAEQILIDKSVTGRGAWTRFFTQLMGALRFDYDGQQLNQAQILAKLYEPEREARRKAAASVTAALKSKNMELTYIFNVLAADKASDDTRRHYASWISARNLSNKTPDAVVEALIGAVTASYDIVARHYELKRKLLGLDTLTDYDRYAPLPFRSESQYSWSEARDIVLQSFRQFSPRIGEITERFFNENWIHAALIPSKRSGAFAHPTVPSAHPFVFLNYTGKARDVQTLAHELGHGLHMFLSAEAQGIYGLYTPLTTAEMASTFGEMLVFDELITREQNKQARLAMLAGKIEDSFATVFRQIAMNRFEHGMHSARRSEGELSSERLSQIWYQTQREMFGDSVHLTDDYKLWWSYIPHFLNTPGYVYAYSFGELLVLALYNLYKKRGAPFVPQYIDVLAAGDSDYPDRILAKIGVDLNDPTFWNEGLSILRGLVEQEERLAQELGLI
ncbi:MAG: M3 family oligoendopeptidase [Chloroflexi bacterium]|nr:M3 family oligoendopeptidase [Chloroflexota bacterium]